MQHSNAARRALRLPNGARFYRCALQVNPFAYVNKHSKSTSYKSEEEYNAAIVQGCRENQIEVIAITDHYQVRTSESLRAAAEHAGIHVLPAFEAVTKDGVHFLCLFDQQRDMAFLERILGDCGIHEDTTLSPTGKYDTIELLIESRKWGAICIAAHVASQGGLLLKLTGQTRINAWQCPLLLACSVPASIELAPDPIRPILQNKNAEHRRERAIAIINAQDVTGPEDLAKPASSCWIKMSEISTEALRQAFLDPPSRIRLASDPSPEDHAGFLAIAWQGGFLSDAAIHFNENLNVLIGGRGTGKSTVVESLRCVLGKEPLGEEARKAHEGIVRNVLKNGTKISLLVRSYRPARREYLIERTIPNPPLVRDASGSVLSLSPNDLVPQVEVYGQHEISELSKSREKLTGLLERFVQRDPSLNRRKGEIRRDLERSRTRITELKTEIAGVVERLAALPVFEETLKRFEEAGLEDRLKEQSLLVREEQVLRTSSQRIAALRPPIEAIRKVLPIDRRFLAPTGLAELPAKHLLAEADGTLEKLSVDLEALASQMLAAVDRAGEQLAAISARWQERCASVHASYEKILRELQKSRIDGEEFLQLRRQIEELQPLKEQRATLVADEKEVGNQRRTLLAAWEDIKAEEFRQLEGAAKRVTKELTEKVRVNVSFAGNREPLMRLLREEIGGRLSEALETLGRAETLSLLEFANACREGRDALVQRFRIPASQAERLAQATEQLTMQIEELDLSPTTRVELNVAAEGQAPVWQALEDLSTGQKATAVLLLLLLESDAPLIVDQPEDDLAGC
jgi:DNA repair ATPase RecN